MSESPLKSWLRKNLQTVLLIVLFPLITYAGSALFREIGQYLSDKISATALWSLLGMLVALCAFLGLLLYLQRNPLRKAYGLLWDRRLNPHCSVCEKQTAMPSSTNYGVNCFCKGCTIKHYPKTRIGENFMSATELFAAVETETGWRLKKK